MSDGQTWAAGVIEETRTNRNEAMKITVEKLREAVAKECDCPIGLFGGSVMWYRVAAALKKLIAAETQPREFTDTEPLRFEYDEIVKRLNFHSRRADLTLNGAVWRTVNYFVAKAHEQSRLAMCRPTAKADKPLDWKNMAINERLEAVGCRSVNDSDMMLTLHDDSTFSIESRTKSLYMTEEEMREVVDTALNLPYAHHRTADNLSGIQDTIRALAGHVADQTAEVTRLRQQGSRCIHAATVGNDTNRYESVPEMLADLNREQCDERGQEIHRLCDHLSERNQTIRELRAELDRLKPKSEWPKYVIYRNNRSTIYLRRLDGPGRRAVYFKPDGTESDVCDHTAKYYLKSSDAKNFFPLIPTAEAEAMIAEAKKRAKPTPYGRGGRRRRRQASDRSM